jgi:hypothetical protein
MQTPAGEGAIRRTGGEHVASDELLSPPHAATITLQPVTPGAARTDQIAAATRRKRDARPRTQPVCMDRPLQEPTSPHRVRAPMQLTPHGGSPPLPVRAPKPGHSPTPVGTQYCTHPQRPSMLRGNVASAGQPGCAAGPLRRTPRGSCPARACCPRDCQRRRRRPRTRGGPPAGPPPQPV